jgi:3-hydroxyisobutyrate/3-hydroxypropionate dehydrogenase
MTGLGVMGYPMAVNLRSKLGQDKTLLICDVSEEAIAKFQKQMEGKGPIKVVKNGFEAAQEAVSQPKSISHGFPYSITIPNVDKNIIVTMLPTASAVEAVYLGPSTGILAGTAAAYSSSSSSSPTMKLIMECGTIETSTILKVNDATTQTDSSLTDGAEVTFVDAPVSGGPMGAQAGTLTFMVGGSSASFTRAKNILVHMGNPDGIFLCGSVGSGTAFKIINNYLSAITSLAASEALNIGAKMNLDLKLLTDVINVSGGQCWVTSKSNPVPGIHKNAPASRGYEGGFRIELCTKVLKMGIELAEMVGARTVLDKATLGAFEEAGADERYKGKDARVVYKWLNESEKR